MSSVLLASSLMSTFKKNQSQKARAVLLEDVEEPAAVAAPRGGKRGRATPAAAPQPNAVSVARGKGARRGSSRRGLDEEDDEEEEEEEEEVAWEEVEDESAAAAAAEEDAWEEEVQQQRAAEASSRAAVAQVRAAGGKRRAVASSTASAAPPPPPPPPLLPQQPLPQPLVLPDGSLLLPDGRRILPDGTVFPAQQPPPPPALQENQPQLDELELAFQREQRALDQDWLLEKQYLAEVVAAAWDAFYKSSSSSSSSSGAVEVYQPMEPLPQPPPSSRPPYNPEDDILPASVARLEAAAEAQLLLRLYPRFRCKISGVRSDSQAGLLATLTAAKAAAEGVLAGEGVPPPHAVGALQEAFLRCPAQRQLRHSGSLGGVVARGDGTFSRAWFSNSSSSSSSSGSEEEMEAQ